MEFINSSLMGKTLSLNKTADPNNKIISNHNPIIAPLNVNWQMDKCLKLGILYREAIKQPLTLVGCKLRDHIPWQYEAIEKDGNCLFRCISKIISGSQEYYAKIRGELIMQIHSKRWERGTKLVFSYYV